MAPRCVVARMYISYTYSHWRIANSPNKQKEMVEWIDALKPSTLLHQDNDIIVHLEERIHKYQYSNSMAMEKGLESLLTVQANIDN